MIQKMLMAADEVDINDMLHHLDWTEAPDRFATVESIRDSPNSKHRYFTVAGSAKEFRHRVDEMIEVRREKGAR